MFTEIPRAVADAECRHARAVADRHDIAFTTFVFPRNRIAHRDVLAAHGFRCYRGRRPHRLPAVPGLRGAASLAGAATGAAAPPAVSTRVSRHGLVVLPASLYLGGFRGRRWRALTAAGPDPALRLARLGVERARRDGGVFHMWLHPNDLTHAAYRDRIDAVLAYVAARHDGTDLRVETMAQVADRTLADAEAPVP